LLTTLLSSVRSLSSFPFRCTIGGFLLLALRLALLAFAFCSAAADDSLRRRPNLCTFTIVSCRSFPDDCVDSPMSFNPPHPSLRNYGPLPPSQHPQEHAFNDHEDVCTIPVLLSSKNAHLSHLVHCLCVLTARRQRWLLSEIIKKSSVPPHILLAFMKEYRLVEQPDWDNIAPPYSEPRLPALESSSAARSFVLRSEPQK
jgi:hypothetical protein